VVEVHIQRSISTNTATAAVAIAVVLRSLSSFFWLYLLSKPDEVCSGQVSPIFVNALRNSSGLRDCRLRPRMRYANGAMRDNNALHFRQPSSLTRQLRYLYPLTSLEGAILLLCAIAVIMNEVRPYLSLKAGHFYFGGCFPLASLSPCRGV
jgi:hypothetical protein